MTPEIGINDKYERIDEGIMPVAVKDVGRPLIVM
jgi:hypothetical protein